MSGGYKSKGQEVVDSLQKMTDKFKSFHPSLRLKMYDEVFDKYDQERKDYRRRINGPRKRKMAIIDNI